MNIISLTFDKSDLEHPNIILQISNFICLFLYLWMELFVFSTFNLKF